MAGSCSDGDRRSTSGCIVLANGCRHGPITRLIAPWDIRELTRPFVPLITLKPHGDRGPPFGIHPPSSIATVTVVLNGEVSFVDATGKQGDLAAAGFACMRTGSVGAEAVWSCHPHE
jgi:redox-sensitive bicupin YhaK (pirin superfamily)